MTGRDPTEPTPDEVERGRAALRELGAGPLPADVLARLQGRLEGELGRVAPVRRRRRRRLVLVLPGAATALAAAVVVAVLASDGSDGRPRPESAATLQARSAAPLAPAAKAGGAAADSTSVPKTFALQVRVPVLVGHSLGYVRTRTRAGNLAWALAAGSCPARPNARVARQQPRAGAVVPAGTTIRVATCAKAGSG